jgi:hypothetical protein
VVVVVVVVVTVVVVVVVPVVVVVVVTVVGSDGRTRSSRWPGSRMVPCARLRVMFMEGRPPTSLLNFKFKLALSEPVTSPTEGGQAEVFTSTTRTRGRPIRQNGARVS